jgi:hypothetical protein
VSSHKQRLLQRLARVVTPEERAAAKEAARDAAVRRELVRADGPSIFPCTLCTKKFQGAEFLYKHVLSRHAAEERVLAVQAGAQQHVFFENFRADAAHVMPPPFAGGRPMHSPRAPWPQHSPHRPDRERDRSGPPRFASPPFRGHTPGGRSAGPSPHERDPRGLRDYRDLDAPHDGAPRVDFRAPAYQ